MNDVIQAYLAARADQANNHTTTAHNLDDDEDELASHSLGGDEHANVQDLGDDQHVNIGSYAGEGLGEDKEKKAKSAYEVNPHTGQEPPDNKESELPDDSYVAQEILIVEDDQRSTNHAYADQGSVTTPDEIPRKIALKGSVDKWP